MEKTKTAPPITDRASETPIEGLQPRKSTNAVSINLEAYMPLLEDTDITDDQKMELLQALYAIMASFVDLGFSLGPSPCGQTLKDVDPSTQALRDHVHSSHQIENERHENAARLEEGVAGEGVDA